ncbi:TPA: hypothetical protein ONC18_002263 [Enterobacter kobei]|nr:hypothetical protein [Enterobacter kobei]
MYKYLAVMMLACTVSGCTTPTSVEKVQASKKNAVRAFDDRSTDVNITNLVTGPTSDLVLVDKGIDGGEWKSSPPSEIGFNSAGKMGTTSNAWLHGAGGWVKYKVKSDGAILTFTWFNPYAGSNSYNTSADPDDYYFTKSGGGGNNASVTWYVRRKEQPTPLNNYSAIIMADPQPWRLASGGDPNSDSQNGSEWREINQNTFKSILTHSDVKFHINNGDLSEFGRKSQYDDYSKIYHSSGAFVTEGLGNHDYANNVNDCMDYEAWGTSKDGCALSAVAREYTAIQNIKNNIAQIPGTSFRSDAYRSTGVVGETVMEDYTGSLAYSWDVGDVHYVQLQNYPTYSVSLSAISLDLEGSAKITDSLNWLADDLEKADLRGKISVINFHDARPASDDGDSHFLDKKNLTELSRFKSIITSHDVKAIFVGHTHQQAYCRAKDDAVFGNIPVYTAGALFKGDYYLLNVKGKEITVKAYNGKTGTPELMQDLGVIGSDTSFSSTCSKL